MSKIYGSTRLDNCDNPILIYGLMRSGTTLLNRILNTHPKLCFTLTETEFLHRYYRKYDPLDKNLPRLLNDFSKNMLSYKIEIQEDKLNSIKLHVIEKGLTYKNLYCAIMKVLCTIDGRWGEKYTGYGSELDDFVELFQDGQVILITRDFRDVFASNKKRVRSLGEISYSRGDYLLIIDDWNRLIKNWNKFKKKHNKKHYLEISYEQLVTNPKQVTKKICKFLEIEWDANMINSEKFKNGDGNTWQANTSFNEKIIGIDKSNVGRHRNELSEEDRYLVQSHVKQYTLHRSIFSIPKLSHVHISDRKKNELQEKYDSVLSLWKERT